jgi:hypothetical protein
MRDTIRTRLGHLALLCAAGAAFAQSVEILPGTSPLTIEGDLSVKMMDGAHEFVERKISESVKARQKHWRRDLSSQQAYEKSVEPNRKRFLQRIGVVDARVPPSLEWFGDDENPALMAETDKYRIFQVR